MDAETPPQDRRSWIEPPSEEWQQAHPGWDEPPKDRDDQPSDAIDRVCIEPVGRQNIPPRPWAYGKFLLFGSAAVIGAVDGGGKGAISVVIALSMITGRPLLGEPVWRTGPVAIVTYEDDHDEWHRRIAAASEHYGIDYQHVLANIHFLIRPRGKVVFAAMGERGPVFPDGDSIACHLKQIGAVLLIVDPFNHSHAFDDGNNNVLIAQVAAEMTRIAQATGTAMLVLHHLRKGSNGSADDLMGATSLRATFRSARILARMTPDEATKLKITDAWRYIRIAGSKENYAPPPDKATWHKLVSILLDNPTETYPEGDSVAVATRWQPRPVFEGMDASALRAVFDELRSKPHGPNKQAKHTPWAGNALMERGGRSDREATAILKSWLENGVITKGDYYHEASKNTVQKVTVNDAKAAEILAELEAFNAPGE